MKKVLLAILLATTMNANANQVFMDATCKEGTDYGGMQKTTSFHQVNIENTTDVTQTAHIKLTYSINGPWPAEVKEWDQQVAPHSWYHTGNTNLTLQFHERNASLFITTASSVVTGFVTSTQQSQCYYRVLRD